MNITNTCKLINNKTSTLYSFDYVSTIISLLLCIDLYYQSKKCRKKVITYDTNFFNSTEYFKEIKGYIVKYKLNVFKIMIIICLSALLSSIIQIYQIQFTSNLYLGKSSYGELFQLLVLFLIDIWSEQLSIKMNDWIIHPITEDCKYDFMEKIKNSRIENLDNKSDHELIHAMEKKVKAIKASPQCVKQLCRAFICIIINTISISSISYVWTLQIIVSTYLYYKHLCWSKLENNKELEKNLSKNKESHSKKTNHIFQDIKSFHQFSNIENETNHQENIINITNKFNTLNQKITIEWNSYNKLIHSVSKLNWVLVVFQIIRNLNTIPKEKIGIVLSACSYLTWNFGWVSNIMTTSINDVASYQTYIDLIDELSQNKKNLKHVSLNFEKGYVNIKDKRFDNGFNQLTGNSGSGKTTFLKNIFFSNKESWDKIAFLYQNSRHEFNNKTPKDSIVGMLKHNSTLLRMVYDCIELDKDKDKILVKPSGGEIQKMKIGMVLYQAILLDAKLLILDEPDNNIDVHAFNQIMKNIRKLFDNSVILFTTHKGELLNFETNKISINKFC